ncbi:MAG: N-formylglutamate amidohydrolase [Bacteroidales bacterium]|nr:N-formylglutamate amidohydrolase [Bacteroidales bacterium]
MFQNIILHVPHSSADFSFKGKDYCPEIIKRWFDNAKDLIDWYTDELFVPEYPDAFIHPIVFHTCQTLCDVERLTHDPLECQGLGITYSNLLPTNNGDLITADKRTHQLYLDHQYRLASALIKYDKPLLIDCHSFSSCITPLQTDLKEIEGIDICIGFNDDFTRPSDEVINLVRSHFEDWGYAVSINTPYSNSKTVETPALYNSLMIEVSKRLYMNEKSLEKADGFRRLKLSIEELYMKLV